MPKEQAIRCLKNLDAEDFSEHMSVLIVREGSFDDPDTLVVTPPEPGELKEWMWSIPGYKVTLETTFVDGELTEINFWDETTMKHVYHHVQAYARIRGIVFDGDGRSYETDVIEIVPAN